MFFVNLTVCGYCNSTAPFTAFSIFMRGGLSVVRVWQDSPNFMAGKAGGRVRSETKNNHIASLITSNNAESVARVQYTILSNAFPSCNPSATLSCRSET
ncbi:hypothetical protein CEXT_325481 [Caerostris extrusa]|uniref:Secreted protein n=1 Tax=Caerostris extrusa TaxID=172846 RepID=A0AAV4T0I4_CAEEX|nr:hypothetical protein CEXT_325481 [Caerostris extrusa]